MTFQQIQYFLTVAERLSFTAAAQQLFMTQPALGRQITALERELNLLLFFRSTRGISLTPAGKYLQQEWQQMMKEQEKVLQHAQHISQGYTGALSIGLLEGIEVTEQMSEIICDFENNHPDILLKLRRASFKDLRNDLLAGSLDIIVTYYIDLLKIPGLSYRHLIRFHPAWAVPLRNPLSKKDELSVKDFRDQELIITGKEDATFGMDLVIQICKTYGGFYPRFFFVDTVDETILRLETGTRCALLNTELSIIHSDKVRMYPFPDKDRDMHYITAAWLSDGKNSSKDLFLNMLNKINI